MDSHNIYSKKGHTATFRPCEILFTEDYETKKEVIIREKLFTSAKGQEFQGEVVKVNKVSIKKAKLKFYAF